MCLKLYQHHIFKLFRLILIVYTYMKGNMRYTERNSGIYADRYLVNSRWIQCFIFYAVSFRISQGILICNLF